jgi:hypothetical protein
MRADLRVYMDALRGQDRNFGKGFEKAQRLAENTRIAYEAARERFHGHIASHGCA